MTDTRERAAEITEADAFDFATEVELRVMKRAIAAALDEAEARGRAEVVVKVETVLAATDDGSDVSGRWLAKRIREALTEEA